MLSADTLMDEETLMKVLRLGHSRVPVHAPGNRQAILGILLVKELVLIDPGKKVPSSPANFELHLSYYHIDLVWLVLQGC